MAALIVRAESNGLVFGEGNYMLCIVLIDVLSTMTIVMLVGAEVDVRPVYAMWRIQHREWWSKLVVNMAAPEVEQN